MNLNNVRIFGAGLIIGVHIMGIAMLIAQSFSSLDLQLTQETADDICINLTNNTAAVAHSQLGKLICEMPSYDSTQNIIVKINNEKGGQP